MQVAGSSAHQRIIDSRGLMAIIGFHRRIIQLVVRCRIVQSAADA
jgi:hypothetical protein